MNLPNKLTIARILLVPVILIIYGIQSLRMMPIFNGFYNLSLCNFIILVLVLIGGVLDILDGRIARKKDMITDLGKFLDPLADKLLVITVLIILCDQGHFYNLEGYKGYGKSSLPFTNLFEWWMLAIVIARELVVTGIRLIAAGKKKVIAASYFGKIKTVLQFATIIYLLLGCAHLPIVGEVEKLATTGPLYYWIGKFVIFAMLAVTIFSGADYVIKNIDVLKDGKETKTKK